MRSNIDGQLLDCQIILKKVGVVRVQVKLEFAVRLLQPQQSLGGRLVASFTWHKYCPMDIARVPSLSEQSGAWTPESKSFGLFRRWRRLLNAADIVKARHESLSSASWVQESGTLQPQGRPATKCKHNQFSRRWNSAQNVNSHSSARCYS